MTNVGRKLFTCLAQAHDFELAMLRDGVISKMIQDAIEGRLTISFSPAIQAKKISFLKLSDWLKKNNLNSKLLGGLGSQIAEQEKFYQQFYGEDFRIDRKKIFVDVRRLPAIKAGLEAGSLNFAMIKVTPDVLTETETRMTEAEFFYYTILKGIKKDGFKIWAEKGNDRWTNLELDELLRRCNPTEPEKFDIEAFNADWLKEIIRVIESEIQVPKVTASMVEIIFTSNSVNIPSNQTIINKDGKIVILDNRSYISAIAKKVRVFSHVEGIILASQIFAKDKTYLTPNTWEWRRDLIDHRDRRTNPFASVAYAYSGGREFYLDSRFADHSHDYGRLRLAL